MIVQLPFDATVLQLFCEMANALALVPEIATLVIDRLLLPVFMTVIVKGDEVEAAGVVGNASAEVERIAVGGVLRVALELLPPQPARSAAMPMDTASPEIRRRDFTPLKLADCKGTR